MPKTKSDNVVQFPARGRPRDEWPLADITQEEPKVKAGGAPEVIGVAIAVHALEKSVGKKDTWHHLAAILEKLTKDIIEDGKK